MEMRQNNSCFKRPISVHERLNHVYAQNHYYDTLEDFASQECVAQSGRIPTDVCRDTMPALNLGLSASLFHGNGLRDTWRYNETLESQEQIFGSEFQPPPNQYLPQEFSHSVQPAFEESYKLTDSSDLEVYKEDMTSCSTSPKIDSSPSMEIWPLVPEETISAFTAESVILANENQDDEEASGDKPYARLIHEALMQAPGHRMMLREIYDWFVQNTTKPSESGTNGWQNSIRHNLSMNQVSIFYGGGEPVRSELTRKQAFENDRTDPTNPGHQARKANSVWILTEDAIRHGVQSTTRYRKHGSNKKTNRTRIPAPLRQRSGAKGGRAARRAARLRREEQMSRQRSESLPHNARLPSFCGAQATDPTSQEAADFSVTSPLTPDNDPAFASSQPSDGSSYCYHWPDFYGLKTEPLPGQLETPYNRSLQLQRETCMKEVFNYPYTSPTQPVES
jgi:Forkhead domain